MNKINIIWIIGILLLTTSVFGALSSITPYEQWNFKNDYSGNVNGEYIYPYGDATRITGLFNNSVYFDGDADYIQNNSMTTSYADAHTTCVEFQINLSASDTVFFIGDIGISTCSNRIWKLQIDKSTGQIVIRYPQFEGGSTCSEFNWNTGYNIATNTPYFVCTQFNESNGKSGIYVNGTNVANTNNGGFPLPDPSTFPTDIFNFGGYSGLSNADIDGYIGNIILFEDELTPSEIEEVYNNGNICEYTTSWDCTGTPASPINFTITAKNNVTNNAITNFSAIVNGTTYTTTNGTITTTINSNDGYLTNITIYANNYFYNTTYTNYNTSTPLATYLNQAQLKINMYDLNNNIINGNFTAINGIQSITNLTGNTIYIPAIIGTNTIYINSTSHYNNSLPVNCTHTGTVNTENCNIYNMTNAYIKFNGSISGSDYQPICSIGGTTLNKYLTYYYSLSNTTQEINCDEYSTMRETNFNITYNGTVINHTQNVNEYYMHLNFSSAVNGTVTWQEENDAGQCCQIPAFADNDTDYNTTTFQYIKLTSAFKENDYVVVRFNEQGDNNSEAQYYEFYADSNNVLYDYIGVESDLNYVVWTNVLSYGDDPLEGATIKFMHYINNNPNMGYITQQRITQAMSGDAYQGTPIYVDYNKNYWITVSKTGYESYSTTWKAIDWQNDASLNIKLKPLPVTIADKYYIVGPTQHSNETGMVFIISAKDDTIYYYKTNLTSTYYRGELSNGGDAITLTNGVHYLNGQNVQLQIYSYNSTTGIYTQETTWNINYVDRTLQDYTENITQNSRFVGTILFIVVVLFASIIGMIINKDGMIDTGYYVFGALIFILGIIYTIFLPLTFIFGLTFIGDKIFSTTRD